MAVNRLDERIKLLLDILDQAYNRKAWHGTTLRGSVRGMSSKFALWRPSKNRHNIWEILLHCAYWKYIIRRRLTEDKDAVFPRKGSDWIHLPEVTDDKTWKRDLALLKDQHYLLREALLNLPPSKLYYVPKSGKIPNIETIYGISSHDLYHAGQIQLIKRMKKG